MIRLGRRRANIECQTIVRDMSQRLWGTSSKMLYDSFTNGEGSSNTGMKSNNQNQENKKESKCVEERSLLICGKSSSGKTTILREFAKVLCDPKGFFRLAVVVLDLNGDLAQQDTNMSDGDEFYKYFRTPESTSREEALLSIDKNKRVDVILVDDVASTREVTLIKDIMKKGISVICTIASANVDELMTNDTLKALVQKKNGPKNVESSENQGSNIFVIDRQKLEKDEAFFQNALFVDMDSQMNEDGKSCHYLTVTDFERTWKRLNYEENSRKKNDKFIEKQSFKGVTHGKGERFQGKSKRRPSVKVTSSNGSRRRRNDSRPRHLRRNGRFVRKKLRDPQFSGFLQNKMQDQSLRQNQDIGHINASGFRGETNHHQQYHHDRNRQKRRNGFRTRQRSNRESILRRKRKPQDPSSRSKDAVPDFVVSSIDPLLPDAVYSFSVTLK